MSETIDDSYIEQLTTLDEKGLRDLKVRWPKTRDDLDRVVDALRTRAQDYGTCVYAMSLAALSAFYLIGHELGVTSFQASCADMDFLRRTRSYEHGFSIVDYSKVLYPQYVENPELWPTPSKILDEDGQRFADEARKLIEQNPGAHPKVLAHWKMLAARHPESQDTPR